MAWPQHKPPSGIPARGGTAGVEPPGGNGTNHELYADLSRQQRKLAKVTLDEKVERYLDERAEGFLALIDRALLDETISSETRAKLAIAALTRLPRQRTPKPDIPDIPGDVTDIQYLDTE